jgi:hypothetical protein
VGRRPDLVQYHPSAIAQVKKGEVTHMHCKEAWRASMAFSENRNLVCEMSECCYFTTFIQTKALSAYVNPACPGITQLLSENHVMDKQVMARKGLPNFVTKNASFALKPLGYQEVLKQFGPLQSQVKFESPDRVNKTLATAHPGFNLKVYSSRT